MIQNEERYQEEYKDFRSMSGCWPWVLVAVLAVAVFVFRKCLWG